MKSPMPARMRRYVPVLALLVAAFACKSKKDKPSDLSNDAAVATQAKPAIETKLTAKQFAEQLETQCTGGGQLACRNLALLYAEGAGVPRDEKKARDLLSAACEAKLSSACTNLGLFLANGYGGEIDAAGSRAAWTKACDGNHLLGCRNLGLVYRDGREVKADGAKAMRYFEKACEGGLAYGCNNQAAMLRDGKLVKADPARAATLFVKSCELGDAAGCRNVGLLYTTGGGGLPKGLPAASVWLRRACDAGDPIGCRALGLMTLKGAGVEKDEAAARKLLGVACARKDLLACETMVKKGWADRSDKPFTDADRKRIENKAN